MSQKIYQRTMELHEIVMKLVGPVAPVGETNADDRRYENLKVLTDLMDKLMREIYEVSHTSRGEFSIKRAADYSAEFLTEIAEYAEEGKP